VKREIFQKAKVRREMPESVYREDAETQSQPRRGDIIVEPNTIFLEPRLGDIIGYNMRLPIGHKQGGMLKKKRIRQLSRNESQQQMKHY